MRESRMSGICAGGEEQSSFLPRPSETTAMARIPIGADWSLALIDLLILSWWRIAILHL
jgi:hypothetical protein